MSQRRRWTLQSRPTGQRWIVSYDETGVKELVSQMVGLGPAMVLLEATGGLELPLVAALPSMPLHEQGLGDGAGPRPNTSRRRDNVIAVGNSGAGKTHVALDAGTGRLASGVCLWASTHRCRPSVRTS